MWKRTWAREVKPQVPEECEPEHARVGSFPEVGLVNPPSNPNTLRLVQMTVGFDPSGSVVTPKEEGCD